MMSYRLKSSNQIKTLFPQMGIVPGLSPNTPIQISNNQSKFYTIYTPDPSHAPKQITMSSDFLELNSISQGFYSIESTPTQPLRSLKITVSKIDWQIIGDRMSMIQGLFFNQARIVWNGLVIPLYYNESQKVDMRCECEEGVWELGENSELNIGYDHQPEEVMEEEELNHEEESTFLVQEEKMDVEGYGNQFLLSQEGMRENGIDPQKYYQILPEDQHQEVESVKSIRDYLDRNNKREKAPSVTLYARFRQCPPDSTTLPQKGSAITSTFFTNSFNPPERFRIKPQSKEDQSHILTTNQYFLSKQSKIHLFLIPVSQNIPTFDKLPFYSKILNQNSVFYDHKIYKIGNQYYLTIIESFKNQTNSISPIKVLQISPNKKFDEDYLKKNIEGVERKIKLLGYGMYLKSTTQEQRAEYHYLINSHLQSLKEDQATNIYALFKLSYEPQINQILNLVNKKENMLIISNNKNGKTFLNAYLTRLGAKLFYLDFQEITNNTSKITDILGFIEYIFQEYGERKVIFIDNVHSLCKAIEGDMHRQQEIISSKIISRHLGEYISLYSRQSVIMTSTHLEILDSELINQSLHHITLKNPPGEIKRSIVSKIEPETSKVNQLSQYFQGMSFHQFFNNVENKQKLNNFYSTQVLKAGQKQESNDFTKVAGLKQAKKIIIETIETPFKYSPLYKNLDIKLPRGVLLYGPSGVGKTFLSNAIQDQMKMKFFEVKGSDILNKYIGASEQAVRDIFEKAASVSPSVIFFDEFESIVPKRNSDNTGVNDRVVNQFLCYLDGVSSIDGVFIVAASSRPEMIDPALLRPGRIDKHVYLEYPNEEQRREMLEMFSRSIEFEFDVKIVVDETGNYSYCDLIGLIKQLRIKKSNEVVKSVEIDREQFKKISLEFFYKVQREYRIAVNVHEQERQARAFKKFANKEPEDIQHQKTILA